MGIVFTDTNKYYLPQTEDRFLHLATMTLGLREFVCFKDVHCGRTYIEEITGGRLEFIEDSELATDLEVACDEAGVLDIVAPSFPDAVWHSNPVGRKYF